MAVPEDEAACERLFSIWKGWELSDDAKIILCSPDEKQHTLIHKLFPRGDIARLGKDRWNLYNPCPIRADLIVACNVFHYLSAPRDAFNNVFAACRFFWMQDLFMRRRGGDREWGDDGDAVRYVLDGAGHGNRYTFDLGVYRDRLMDYRCYDGGSYKTGRTTVHFAAAFRGDLLKGA